MKVRNILQLLLVCLTFSLRSQETQTTTPVPPTNDSLQKSIFGLKKDIEILKNLKITGWVQAQFQIADTAGAKNFDGGNFPTASSNRFMIRRGRIKFTYNQKNSQYVLQLNGTERGVNLVEIFGKYTDPWIHSVSLQVGVMNRPWGFEIEQSSSDRESPERSTWTQNYLPNERDIGAKLIYTGKGKLAGLRLDAGFYNGTGIAVPGTGAAPGGTVTQGVTQVVGFTDFDYVKDFIGRLSYYKSFKDDKIKIGIGASHYNGGFVLQNNKLYTSIKTDSTGNKVWVMADTSTTNYRGRIAPRVYYGVEGLFSVKSIIGTTTIRGEYFTGTQTGTDASSASPAALPSSTAAMYVRNFSAGYAYFIQRLGKSKHELVFKYEWLDPNTKVSAADLNGKNGMKDGEIKYTMMGIGYNFYLDNNVKFMFHYNIVANEVVQLKGYTYDLKDNIFTARMQYRF